MRSPPKVIVRFGAKHHPASSSAGVALHPPAPIGPAGTRVGFGGYLPLAPGVPTIRYPIPKRIFDYVSKVQSATGETC
jgi:hypothetical protein